MEASSIHQWVLLDAATHHEAEKSNTVSKETGEAELTPEHLTSTSNVDFSSSSSEEITLTNKLDDEANCLRRKLVNLYANMNLPTIPWMGQRILAMSTFFVPLQLKESGTYIPIEKIFDSDYRPTSAFDRVVKLFGGSRENDAGSKRILIEAPFGYGKSSLAHKIIYDWAMKRDYIKQFKFAFLITVSKMQQEVTKEIEDIAETSGFDNKNVLRQLLKHYTEKTLIVIDGLDDLNNSNRESIINVLHKKKYYSATVIATSRTGTFELTREEKKLLSTGISTNCQFYERKINIQGLTESNRSVLLKMLVEGDDNIKSIEKIIEPVKDLFECPFFTILLAQIVNENIGTEMETKTELYTCLVNAIVRLSMAKCGITLPKVFTLFNDSESFSKYRNSFFRFGELATKSLQAGSPYLECTIETNEICEMGFLVKQRVSTNFSTYFHYEGIHRSIVEFAIAFSLWIEYLRDGKMFNRELIVKIIHLLTKCRDYFLIVPFLCGLLREDVVNLFTSLTPFSAIFSISRDTNLMLSECKSSEKLADAVIKFFPPVVCHAPENFLDNCQLWEKIFKWKRVQFNHFSTTDLETLPKYFKMLSLDFTINSERTTCQNQFKVEGLECNKLKFVFDCSCAASQAQFVETWLTIFRSMSANQKKIEFKRELTPLIADCLKNTLQNAPLHKLECSLTNQPAEKVIVLHLVKYGQLKKLTLTIESDLYLDAVIQGISASACLETVHINGHKNTIDIGKLTNGGKKHWKKLGLRDTNVTCASPINNSRCISVFVNIGCTNDFRVIRSIIPDVLICSCDYILQAYNVTSFNTGWDLVKELVVESQQNASYETLSWCLTLLRSRNQSLVIRLKLTLSSTINHKADESNMINCLKTNSISDLCLQFPNDVNIPWSTVSFASFPEIILRESIKIQTVILTNYVMLSESKSLMHAVLNCLNDGWIQVVMISFDWLRERLTKIVNDFDIDCTKYKICHSTVNECRIFRHDLPGCHECICISLL